MWGEQPCKRVWWRGCQNLGGGLKWGGGGQRGSPKNGWGSASKWGKGPKIQPPPQVMNMYGDLVMDAVPDKVRGGQGGGAAL